MTTKKTTPVVTELVTSQLQISTVHLETIDEKIARLEAELTVERERRAVLAAEIEDLNAFVEKAA